MKLSKIFGKAMIDQDVKGIKQLAEIAGISYEKTIRIMKDQSSAKHVDILAVANCLGLKLKFVSHGDGE
jgi:DNA-binding phage protein